MHTCLVDQVALASLSLWRYTELTYTLHMLSILYTVRGIATVLLHYVISYNNGMNIVT